MREITTELQRFHGPACVSILAKTHRTHPDNKQDAILLENLIQEAQTRLEQQFDKAIARERAGQLRTLASAIDHKYNLDGLLLVAGDGVAEAVQLPVTVESRVVIDNNFATRDLVRALHEQSAYYVLVLNQKQGRLILAYSDRLVEELGEPFPIENTLLHPKSREERASAAREDQFIDEFFNRVDKLAKEATKTKPFPLVVAADRRNFDRFQSVADDKSNILAHLEGSAENAKAQEIVSRAWGIVKNRLADRNEARIGELRQAVSQGKFLSDLSDIWTAIREGRGRTLFVEHGYFQPARIDGNRITPEKSAGGQGVLDDVVDEMIELNLQFGGDIVFCEAGKLADFQKLALVTRF